MGAGMRRRDFLVGGMAAAWPLAARAQQAAGGARIGILTSGNQLTSPVIEKFRRELRNLGYVEGRDITIEFRSSALDPARLTYFATELVQAPVDVLVTDSAAAMFAAKKATTAIPIVGVL